jgi:D-ribose pyranase
MLKSGIINPALASLVCRFRHTNWLIIADRNFPSWREVETVDITLDDDMPTVCQVLQLLGRHCVIGAAFMAAEFKTGAAGSVDRFQKFLPDAPIQFEPHVEFKKRVPHATGLIRTGDTTPYANIALQSA